MPIHGLRLSTAVIVLLHLACGGSRPQQAAPPKLGTPRAYFMGAALPGGRILVTGGINQTGTLGTAELFEPELNTFRPTGSMRTERVFGTATLLPNGKVLLAGGFDRSSNQLSSAELFDPYTGRFRPASPMTCPRAKHTANILPDGKVLIAGGEDELHTWASAELFDPATETFISTGPMKEGRRQHSATTLSDGRVLVAGGWRSSPDFTYLASTEVYDPAAGGFTPAGPLGTPRCNHEAILIPNGNILITGGYQGITSVLSAPELFNPGTSSFSPSGPLGVELDGHTVFLGPNGNPILAGGSHPAGVDPKNGRLTFISLAGTVIFNPNTETFEEGPTLGTPRHAHSVFPVGKDQHMLVGGQNGALFLDSVEIIP